MDVSAVFALVIGHLVITPLHKTPLQGMHQIQNRIVLLQPTLGQVSGEERWVVYSS